MWNARVTGGRSASRVKMGSDIVTHPNLMTEKKEFRTWMCLICGFVYDEAAGLPDEGIPPGTRWEDIPINWTCPECGARKEDFEMVEL
jgi:rubredoxin